MDEIENSMVIGDYYEDVENDVGCTRCKKFPLEVDDQYNGGHKKTPGVKQSWAQMTQIVCFDCYNEIQRGKK